MSRIGSDRGSMEGGESILEAIYEADNLDDVDDVEMVDIEEGECLELNNKPKSGQTSGRDVKMVNQGTQSRNRRRKENKKRNKKKKSAVPKVTDINRFVLDTCRLLKERKSYLVWTAIGCLGRSALSELVNEVNAIQACGGQMTTDGRRYRTGGGILWSILKTRDPNAYREIMKRGKEFEKQFKQPVEQSKKASQVTVPALTDPTTPSVSNGSRPMLQVPNQIVESSAERQGESERVSVHSRIRVPVSYDDGLLGDDDHKDGFDKHDDST